MQTLFSSNILAQAHALADALAALPLPEQVPLLNQVRVILHEASPFHSEPVDCVQWLPTNQVQGNDYNPNRVAPPEMKLLKHSVEMDGFTQPVVAWQAENGIHEVVDGFHRTRVAKEYPAVRNRLHGYVPVTVIKNERTGRDDRIASTIRHNRARGVHGIKPMTDVVAELIVLGLNDVEIAKELGMDADEVLRFKQVKGLPSLFEQHEYSRSWE